ncbi:sugar-binding domain-containing protein [Clostridiaceae bacterium HSG29]|nr:sugar-binding domain-containing protein [Clostridiaceae bacterium HSG29]
MNEDKSKTGDFLKVLFKLAPEFQEIFIERYEILKIVNMIEPVGRRILSVKMDISERIIRKETDKLKENKLLDTTLKGMIITDEGKKVLEEIDKLYHMFKGIDESEKILADYLGIKKVIIAPLNLDDDKMVLSSIGECASKYLMKIINDKSIIGITGGSSVQSVIERLNVKSKKYRDVKIIPTRGSLGDKAEYQSNTLAEILANKLSCNYKLLSTPDKLSEGTIKELQNEPEIRETINLINSIDTLVFGIGRSDIMAKRRGLYVDEMKMIQDKGAVAEAFGYYFNSLGEVVHEINTIGIDLHKFKQTKNLIAVAGGIEKVEAIRAITKLDSKLVLVTDENVASEILKDFRRRKNG